MSDIVYDVAIIGGGINGCATAADAAMRGLSVFLCEQDDLASKTSSSSSKLIHGGLRYVELGHLSLVKKALEERQRLLTLAPHLVHPLPFVLPHNTKQRPRWLIRTGLFIYDNLSRINQLPHALSIKRTTNEAYFHPLNQAFKNGFLFYDATTDDARLTIANALQAKQYGANIAVHTQLIASVVHEQTWRLTLQPKFGEAYQIKAKSLVNAAGPWVECVNKQLNLPMQHELSLVKGSHIVVKALYQGEQAYLMQHDDKRVLFVIPYHGFSLIGTTEMGITEATSPINIEPQETDYLLSIVNHYFKRNLNKSDIVQTWSGIRPLIANHSKQGVRTLNRDYSYHVTHTPAPCVTIYGGKITTYRKLALEVVDALHTVFPHIPASKTAKIGLPGANLGDIQWTDYLTLAEKKYAWLDKTILNHYLKYYGTLTETILNGCHSHADLGQQFNDKLFQVEVDYLIKEEWAHCSEDIIWRRSKLGLVMNCEQIRCLDNYMKTKVNAILNFS